MTLVSLKYGAFQHFESGPSSGKLVGTIGGCDKHTAVMVKQQSSVFAVSSYKFKISDLKCRNPLLFSRL
jgi:hypothetical protein